MEQLKLDFMYNIHPRSVFNCACDSLNIELEADYIKSDLNIEVHDKKLLKVVTTVLQQGKGGHDILEAFKIFYNKNYRALLEGVLYHYNDNQTGSILNISPNILSVYRQVFFNTVSFDNNPIAFYSHIRIPAIKTWFTRCRAMRETELRFLLTHQEEEEDLQVGLRKMFNRFCNISLALGQVPDEITDKGQVDRLMIAQQMGSFANSCARTLLQYSAELNPIKDAQLHLKLKLEKAGLLDLASANKETINEEALPDIQEQLSSLNGPRQ